MEFHLTRKTNEFTDTLAFTVLIGILAIEVIRIVSNRFGLNLKWRFRLQRKIGKYLNLTRTNTTSAALFNGAPIIIVDSAVRSVPSSTKSAPEILYSKKSDTESRGQIRSIPFNKDSINSYDLFKLVSTLAMFADHYGYFGLPGLDWNGRNWARIIGRFAAPGFFYLCGYSLKRFRLRVWMAALYLYFFTVVIRLGIVHSPFESILTIALINCVFYYLPPHKYLKNILSNVIIFGILFYFRQNASTQLNIGYGTLPFMIAISGDLCRNKHRFRYVWVVVAMAAFCYASILVFGDTLLMQVCIGITAVINALIMITFSMKTFPIFDRLPQPFIAFIRDGIKWLSRQGLIVYIGHLMLYRLIQNWQNFYAYQ